MQNYPVSSQYNVQPTAQSASTIPAASTSGVNIIIQNPAVNVPGYYSQPVNNFACYPPSYYINQPAGSQPISSIPVSQPQQGEKLHKKKIVQLTDDYIKTLENYLNSPVKDVRMSGAKELMSRFAEESSRRNDPALTALLNKALQDPHRAIRAVALNTLCSKYAQGDEKTRALLQGLTSSKALCGQESIMASDALLSTAENPITVYTDEPQKTKSGNKSNKE